MTSTRSRSGPICFSARPSRSCRRSAGRDRQGRQGSRRLRPPGRVGEDEQKLVALEKAGKLKRIPFKDRAAMKKLVDPVMAAYAKEIGADGIFTRSSPPTDPYGAAEPRFAAPFFRPAAGCAFSERYPYVPF
jgi:hypothetical protein